MNSFKTQVRLAQPSDFISANGICSNYINPPQMPFRLSNQQQVPT